MNIVLLVYIKISHLALSIWEILSLANAVRFLNWAAEMSRKRNTNEYALSSVGLRNPWIPLTRARLKLLYGSYWLPIYPESVLCNTQRSRSWTISGHFSCYFVFSMRIIICVRPSVSTQTTGIIKNPSGLICYIVRKREIWNVSKF